MDVISCFAKNLDSLLGEIIVDTSPTYPVDAALKLVHELPVAAGSLPAFPISLPTLFREEPSPNACKTDCWIVDHHSLMPDLTMAGLVQVFPRQYLTKAHKVYGLGYQTLPSGHIAFSPLYAVSIGKTLFPGFSWLSRTRQPVGFTLPDRPYALNRAAAASPAPSASR